MKKKPGIKVLFVAGFGPIVRDREQSEKFYIKDLGLSFTVELYSIGGACI